MGWGRYRLGYSVSRLYVDRFWEAHRQILRGRVLDVGGSRMRRFGRFDVFALPLAQVEVVNPDPREGADYVCGLEDLHVPAPRYDAIRMSEVLEHARHPDRLLMRAFQLLRPGGHLLATVPFIYRHHDDHDYGRWPLPRLAAELADAGFVVQRFWSLGGAWAVLADVFKQLCDVGAPRWARPLAQLAAAGAQLILVDGLDRWAGPEGVSRLWTTQWGVHARRV